MRGRRRRGPLAVRDEGTVACNDDLLAENVIPTTDGSRLIDDEDSGDNDACFELGDIWSASNLSLWGWGWRRTSARSPSSTTPGFERLLDEAQRAD